MMSWCLAVYNLIVDSHFQSFQHRAAFLNKWTNHTETSEQIASTEEVSGCKILVSGP